MRLRFEDDDLRRLFEDLTFHLPQFGPDLVKAFRKKVGFLQQASSEQDLRAMSSLHFEKLVGDRKGQHSIRLNDQWRLILRLEQDVDGRLLVVIEVVDYH